MRNWLGVPVRAKKGIIGILVAHSYDPAKGFGETEKKLLHFVSLQLASLMERLNPGQAVASIEITDETTLLPNLRLFRFSLSQVMGRARRTRELVAVLSLNLDHFHHSISETERRYVIRQMAERLKRHVREGDMVARTGDDEFIWSISNLQKLEDVALIAEKMLAVTKRPLEINGKSLVLTGSIGIAVYPFDGADPDGLIRYSQDALARFRETGGDTYYFHNAEVHQKVSEQLARKRHLRQALAKKEFLLYYQTVALVETQKIDGVETFVRWKDPQGKIILPAGFLKTSVEAGMMPALDEWILRTACEQWKKWEQDGWKAIRLAVNLSSRMLQQENFEDRIMGVIQETEMPPEKLELEFTDLCMSLLPG